MEYVWTEEFYRETDAAKRLEILKQNEENDQSEAMQFRKKIWIARYGKRKPTKDVFIGCLMELKYIAEGTSFDLVRKKKKEAARIIYTLGLEEVAEQEKFRDMLLLELVNVFLKFIEVSKSGRGFTSLVFGMGQLSEEGVVKKIAEQISTIAFQAPHTLHMDKEFALLQEAALLAFRQEYPNREHFLKK